MSPTGIRAKRDDCDGFDNNCRSGAHHSWTCATSIALIVIFILFVSCFVMRRRRRQRFTQSIHIAPLSHPPPQQNTYNTYNPPPAPFFEPAPPYDPTKGPPPPDSAPPAPHSSPPEHSNPPPGTPAPQLTVPPVQYPPPSYSPA